MPRQCPTCQKQTNVKGKYVKTISRYNPTGKFPQRVNLQWAQIPSHIQIKPFSNFAGQRIKICTKCKKTLRKYLKEGVLQRI